MFACGWENTPRAYSDLKGGENGGEGGFGENSTSACSNREVRVADGRVGFKANCFCKTLGFEDFKADSDYINVCII